MDRAERFGRHGLLLQYGLHPGVGVGNHSAGGGGRTQRGGAGLVDDAGRPAGAGRGGFALGTLLLAGASSAILFGSKAIPPDDARLVVELSLATVLLGFFQGTLSAPISAVNGGGISQAALALAKLGELAAIIALAWSGGGPVAMTAVPVVSALVQSLAFVVLTRRLVPWLRISPFLFDKKAFRRLLHPSLGQFLLYASGNIIAIQLAQIVLGYLAGAPGVALYSVTVTYTRSARMLTSVVAQSFQVELTRAFGERKFALTARLVETICQMGGWLTALAMLALFAFAGPLFYVWTRGKLDADHVLVAILGVTAVCGAYNEGFVYLLTGINRVWAIAIGHVTASISATVIGIAAFPLFGLHGVAAALTLPEVTLAVVGIAVTAQALDTGYAKMFRESVRLPINSMRAEAGRAAALLARAFRS